VRQNKGFLLLTNVGNFLLLHKVNLVGRWGKVMNLFKYDVQLHTENRADICKFSTAALSV